VKDGDSLDGFKGISEKHGKFVTGVTAFTARIQLGSVETLSMKAWPSTLEQESNMKVSLISASVVVYTALATAWLCYADKLIF
jgi:hypothetical protein